MVCAASKLSGTTSSNASPAGRTSSSPRASREPVGRPSCGSPYRPSSSCHSSWASRAVTMLPPDRALLIASSFGTITAFACPDPAGRAPGGTRRRSGRRRPPRPRARAPASARSPVSAMPKTTAMTRYCSHSTDRGRRLLVQAAEVAQVAVQRPVLRVQLGRLPRAPPHHRGSRGRARRSADGHEQPPLLEPHERTRSRPRRGRRPAPPRALRPPPFSTKPSSRARSCTALRQPSIPPRKSAGWCFGPVLHLGHHRVVALRDLVEEERDERQRELVDLVELAPASVSLKVGLPRLPAGSRRARPGPDRLARCARRPPRPGRAAWRRCRRR